MLNVDGFVLLIKDKIVQVSKNPRDSGSYDIRAKKITLDDPDMKFQFRCNAFMRGGSLHSLNAPGRPLVPLSKKDQIKIRQACEYVLCEATVDVEAANKWVEIHIKQLQDKVDKRDS